MPKRENASGSESNGSWLTPSGVCAFPKRASIPPCDRGLSPPSIHVTDVWPRAETLLGDSFFFCFNFNFVFSLLSVLMYLFDFFPFSPSIPEYDSSSGSKEIVGPLGLHAVGLRSEEPYELGSLRQTGRWIEDWGSKRSERVEWLPLRTFFHHISCP